MSEIRRGEVDDTEDCVSILQRLPDYFSPDTHDELAAAVQKHRFWVAETNREIVGVLVAEQRYTKSAEITFAAIDPVHRRRGIGRRLVVMASGQLAEAGVDVIEVKTLDASAGYEPYVATRAFWESCGFVQIDCIDPLPGWSPGNPSAIYVATSSVASSGENASPRPGPRTTAPLDSR